MITTPEQRKCATEMRKLMAAYRDAKDLIEIGAYVSGTNAEVDRAIQLNEFMNMFLQQGQHEVIRSIDSWYQLSMLVGINEEI